MFKKLMPKEEKYFEDFATMISYLQEMGKITNDFFSNSTYDKDIYLKLKPIEKRCDEITSKVIKRLNKTFITPFDREDIFALIKKLDDIGDILYGATIRIDMYNVNVKVEHAEELSAIIVQQLNELNTLIQYLKKHDPHITEHKTIKDLEEEADNIYRNSIKQLFQNEKDPLTIIKTKEILEMLEEATDKCQSTASIIHAIFIKNS
ncbi:MAG TPA: DUF47 family protein [Ignavibacteriaceae bacterium]|nr:DUF47 family protein [Ignavibacteriaceae bacterium]